MSKIRPTWLAEATNRLLATAGLIAQGSDDDEEEEDEQEEEEEEEDSEDESDGYSE
jgi:ribosomal protein L12E/L44/L45/RPP1/RPP2